MSDRIIRGRIFSHTQHLAQRLTSDHAFILTTEINLSYGMNDLFFIHNVIIGGYVLCKVESDRNIGNVS